MEINEVKEDVGIIQRTEDLPIIAIDAAMTSTRHSFVAFKIGPLICSNGTFNIGNDNTNKIIS